MHDDEEVGYGKPPKATRFKKGQSGNPKGRPKGSRNFSTDVKATLEAPVQLKIQGRDQTVATQQAALLRLREKALTGDARALDRLLGLARTYNDDDPTEAVAVVLPSEDRAILDGYVDRQLRRREQVMREKEDRRESNHEAPDDDP